MLLEILTQKLHVFDGHRGDRQLDAVAEVVGGRKLLDWAQKYRVALSDATQAKLARVPGITFDGLIPYQRSHFRDVEALDLVEKMLAVDHKERISAEEALEHPFFEIVRRVDVQQQR
jgi:casein kinase II subunit alpha